MPNTRAGAPAGGNTSPSDSGTGGRGGRPQILDSDGSGAAPALLAPAGLPRSFLVGLLLFLVTLGLYSLYYHYKVFQEVDQQEGQRHMSGLYAAVVVLQVLAAIVAVGAADGATPPDVVLAQPQTPEQPSMEPVLSPTPGGGGGGAAPPAFLLGLLAVVGWGVYIMMESAVLNQGLARLGLPPVATLFIPLTAVGAFFASQLRAPAWVLVILVIVALMGYAALQDGLNRYWDAVGSEAPPAPRGAQASGA